MEQPHEEVSEKIRADEQRNAYHELRLYQVPQETRPTAKQVALLQSLAKRVGMRLDATKLDHCQAVRLIHKLMLLHSRLFGSLPSVVARSAMRGSLQKINTGRKHIIEGDIHATRKTN